MPIDRHASRFLGIDFDSATYPQLVEELDGMSRRASFSYVVTPNVDHVLMLNPDVPNARASAFRDAYAAAEIRLCDSRILQGLAKLHGVKLDVLTGSDLTAYLFRGGHFAGRKVAIIGGDAQMPAELLARFPNIEIVQHRPPMGVLKDSNAMDAIIAFIERECADYALLAIGAPQSEMAALKCLENGNARGVGLCIGASIEFVLGRKRRAPKWVQQLGLEWAFRLASEPRRLWWRYLVTGPRIFQLAWQWRKRPSMSKES